MLFGLFLYTIPIIALLFVIIYKPFRKYYVLVKIISSLAFVGAAIYYGLVGDNVKLLLQMLPGFLLCMFGDVFMGCYNGIKKKRLLLAGIATFLLGHVCFIASMTTIQPLEVVDFIFPLCGVGITVGVTGMKRMLMGKMRPYTYVYSFFVSLLFSKAVHIVYMVQNSQTICLALGATLFLTSDFLILFLYFYDKRPWTTHGWNLVTYYYGIYLLALSLYFA